MRDQVHYYSTYDMSIPFELKKAGEVVEKYKAGWRPVGVNDVIELYNIWLFVENGVYRTDWTEGTLTLVRTEFKEAVAHFFAGLKKDTWVSAFKQVDVEYTHWFWEILDRFNFGGILDVDTLREAFAEKTWELRELLQQERLVNRHQQAVAELLKENEQAAEWLLQEYVQDDDIHDRKRMFFPKALSFQDREEIISRYLDTERPNLNYVRLVLLARKDANLRLSDALRLKAQRVEQRLNEQLFPKENQIQHRYGVSISKVPGKPMKWVEQDENGDAILCYSRQIMLLFKGPDVLHYLRYGFEFLTINGLITLIAKASDAGSFERVFAMRGKYSYPTNFSFQYKEGISLLQIESMQCVLQEEGTNIEASLKAFYEQYLKERFGFPSGTLSLADVSADWLTKCKAIVPEIDAIAHRYDQYAKTGKVDDELLRLSTENVRITEVSSANRGRYYNIKGQPAGLFRLFFLFFSDQSMLTFVEPFKENHNYHSFYELITEQDGLISYDSYEEYQHRDIDYLIDTGYLSKGSDGKLYVEKMREINLLRQLYEYHACPFLLNEPFERELLEEMEKKGWVEKDNHLLTEEERNYFDYYMYNTKYTNGPALRNRYAHGSHADPTKVNIHRNAYNRLLALLILELLKIEDDLICQQLANKEQEAKSAASATEGAPVFLTLASIAEVGTYSTAQSKHAGEEYLTLPKKYGIMQGYAFLNTARQGDTFAYYVKPGEAVLVDYLAFLLNASLIRLSIVQDPQLPENLTIEKIKSISLPIVSLPDQQIYGRLEWMLSAVVAKGESRTREETLQYNAFSNLRDYLCLQILRPDYTQENNLEFIAPFKEILVRLDDAGNGSSPSELLKELLIPGNPLLEAMQTARTILEESASTQDTQQ